MEYKRGFIYKDDYSLYEKLVKTHLLYKHIELQEVSINIFIIFVMFGINEKSYKIILDNKIVTSKQMISNHKTLLKDKKLINKIKNNQWEILPPLNVKIDNEFNINIKCIKN